jgi:ribosomal protein S27AE
MQDGTRYRSGRDGRVQVRDEHADAIRRGWYGQAGVMVAAEATAMGTKTVRVCPACAPGGRRWNAWSTQCPRCGQPTIIEELQ